MSTLVRLPLAAVAWLLVNGAAVPTAADQPEPTVDATPVMPSPGPEAGAPGGAAFRRPLARPPMIVITTGAGQVIVVKRRDRRKRPGMAPAGVVR